jgi:hypothetical protein
VALLLALAHRLQEAIDDGIVEHAAEAARLLGVSRARVTQLLDLTLLPVAVQERVLFAKAVDGKEPVTERGMRRRGAVTALSTRTRVEPPALYSTSLPAYRRAASSRGSARGSGGSPGPFG